MRFSNPSRAAFEKGRLFGSAQTRSSRACAVELGTDRTARIAPAAKASAVALRELEHIERSSLGGDVLEIPHDVDEAERRRSVADVEVARDHGAGPAADAGQDRDVLVPVRSAIGGRLADDSRCGLELPKLLAGAGVERFEPAFHVAVEDDVPGRHDGAAPDREVLLVRPDRAAFLDVPSLDHAAVTARPRLEAHFGPDI